MNRTKEGSAHSSYHVKLDDRGATKNVNVTDIMLDTKQISHVHSASKNIEDNISVHRHSHTVSFTKHFTAISFASRTKVFGASLLFQGCSFELFKAAFLNRGSYFD